MRDDVLGLSTLGNLIFGSAKMVIHSLPWQLILQLLLIELYDEISYTIQHRLGFNQLKANFLDQPKNLSDSIFSWQDSRLAKPNSKGYPPPITLEIPHREL